MWWTTGFGWDRDKITDDLTSWEALWDAQYRGKLGMLDDMPARSSRSPRSASASTRTRRTEAELDQTLALLEQQKPLVRTYTTDDIGDDRVGHDCGSPTPGPATCTR